VGEQVTMQSPMSTALMRKREAIATFLRRFLLRVESLVDHDASVVKENGAKDIGVGARARHAEQFVGVIELDAKLEVLLDDVIDGDRGLDRAADARILIQQCRGVALDCLLGEIRDEPGNLKPPSSFASSN
jgi:hypothetical protein